MSLITLGEYLVEDSLLTPGGLSIEIGVRSMDLANEVIARGMQHVAIEPDPSVVFPSTGDFTFANKAVVGDASTKECVLIMADNVLTHHLAGLPFGFTMGREVRRVRVATITIDEVMASHGVTRLELLAMDCEGAEEQILLSLTRPVSKQVSVEFHEHCGQSARTTEKIVDHMKSLGYSHQSWVSQGVQYGLFVFGRKESP